MSFVAGVVEIPLVAPVLVDVAPACAEEFESDGREATELAPDPEPEVCGKGSIAADEEVEDEEVEDEEEEDEEATNAEEVELVDVEGNKPHSEFCVYSYTRKAISPKTSTTTTTPTTVPLLLDRFSFRRFFLLPYTPSPSLESEVSGESSPSDSGECSCSDSEASVDSDSEGACRLPESRFGRE